MIIKLVNVRICYCHSLFRATQVMGVGEPKYSSTFLMPKGSHHLKTIQNVIVQVATEKWGAKAQANLQALMSQGKIFLRDGVEKPDMDDFEGCMFFNASRSVGQGAVVVVNNDQPNNTELTEADGVIYAGCYVDVSIDVYAQDHKEFGKRINAVLRAVRFRADGEALSGSAPAKASEFDDISDTGAQADIGSLFSTAFAQEPGTATPNNPPGNQDNFSLF